MRAFPYGLGKMFGFEESLKIQWYALVIRPLIQYVSKTWFGKRVSEGQWEGKRLVITAECSEEN